MKYGKVATFAVALLMLAVGGAAFVFAHSDQSNAEDMNYVSNGTFGISVNFGSGWAYNGMVQGYDGAIALDRFLDNNHLSHDVDDTLYSYEVGVDYPTMDYEYGKFTTINGFTNTDTVRWHTYIMNTSGSWVSATDTLGFYKPFGDYDASHRTANIALFYGTDSAASAAISNYTPAVTATIVPLTDIIGNPNFRVPFYIKVDQDAAVQAALEEQVMEIDVDGLTITAQQVNEGVYVYGYGSDFYTALKQALPNHVTGSEVVPRIVVSPTYDIVYSWLDELLGLSTIQVTGSDTPTYYDDDSWAWWQEYFLYSVDPVDGDIVNSDTSDFALGFISPLNDAPITHTTFALYFSIGGM